EYLRAIGTVSLAYNWMELSLDGVLDLYIKEGAIILCDLKNDQKIQRLRRSLSLFEHNQEHISLIDHYLLLFSSCAQNRNIIVHSFDEFDGNNPRYITLNKTSLNRKILNTGLVLDL